MQHTNAAEWDEPVKGPSEARRRLRGGMRAVRRLLPGSVRLANIGFIGIGTMGREMALNLLKGGHKVVAYDVRQSAAEELQAAGAIVAANVADASRPSDMIITMLPDTPHVEETVFAPGGLLQAPPAGKLIVDMSTISPQATQKMRKLPGAIGVSLLDAPFRVARPGPRTRPLDHGRRRRGEAVERARPSSRPWARRSRMSAHPAPGRPPSSATS